MYMNGNKFVNFLELVRFSPDFEKKNIFTYNLKCFKKRKHLKKFAKT